MAINKSLQRIIINKDFLQNIFDEIDDAILILDSNNNIIYSNPYSKAFFNSSLLENNLFLVLKDLDSISFFDYIIHDNCDGKIRKFKNRYVKITKKMIRDFLFIFIKDVTPHIQYKTFKTELVGNIAHELKTPLSLIMGYAETLLINESISKEKKKKFLELIYESTKRIDALIKDIISLHSLENLEPNFQVEDATSLQRVEENLKTIFENANKKLIFSISKTSVFIKEEHLISVLTNLIDNALKYSDGKNIYISISKFDKQIIIKVEDEGPIIPEEDRERIFERFYTRSKSRNKQITGTGLGLSIVKHIATLYNGSITLTTNSYHGNTFEIKLIEKKR
ncbi:sensor histidine kinase [Deferribacter abyssi]|uniref:sensor histidine kinase n=1 Tax=Deferribacter abyssi TaxID=213806 RepID=UPI003C26B549